MRFDGSRYFVRVPYSNPDIDVHVVPELRVETMNEVPPSELVDQTLLPARMIEEAIKLAHDNDYPKTAAIIRRYLPRRRDRALVS